MIDNVKQTEWNSSLACLIRIDELIQVLHKAALGFYSNMDNNKTYMITLDRLFMEGMSKLTPDEMTNCEKYQKEIEELKVKWNIDTNEFNNISTKNNMNGWKILIPLGKQYERELVKDLDAHNMLLKNARDTRGL